MKISDEIIGALSGLALLWSIRAMVKSQFIDKHDANGNLINPNEVFCDSVTSLEISSTSEAASSFTMPGMRTLPTL
jgi:hypothetical protein